MCARNKFVYHFLYLFQMSVMYAFTFDVCSTPPSFLARLWYLPCHFFCKPLFDICFVSHFFLFTFLMSVLHFVLCRPLSDVCPVSLSLSVRWCLFFLCGQKIYLNLCPRKPLLSPILEISLRFIEHFGVDRT